MQCVPSYRLTAHTFTATMEEIRAYHSRWLDEYLHVRYWLFPYSDKIVVGLLKPDDGTEVWTKSYRIVRLVGRLDCGVLFGN